MDVQKRLEILEKEQAQASAAVQENLQARLKDELALYEKEGLADHAARVRAQLEEEKPKPQKATRKKAIRKKSAAKKRTTKKRGG